MTRRAFLARTFGTVAMAIVGPVLPAATADEPIRVRVVEVYPSEYWQVDPVVYETAARVK